MKTIVTLALAAGIALGTAGVAEARQGCGPDHHRGPHGRCVPNGGPAGVAITPHGLVIGNFYHGRGYWDGHRYYQHRGRHGAGWRYW